jgi:hypothetical membrane protein
MTPISGPDHNHLTIGKADISMRTFLALLLTGILLSIVGAFVEGLPWLTAVGMLTFFSAAVYAVLSSRTQERRDDTVGHSVHYSDEDRSAAARDRRNS